MKGKRVDAAKLRSAQVKSIERGFSVQSWYDMSIPNMPLPSKTLMPARASAGKHDT